MNQSSVKSQITSMKSYRKSLESLKQTIVQKIIQLYDSASVSRKHLQTTVNFARDIVKEVSHAIRDISKDGTHSVESISHSLNTIFDDIAREYKRISLLTKLGHYMTPAKYIVGTRLHRIKRTHDGQFEDNSIKAYGYLFPLRDMFKKSVSITRKLIEELKFLEADGIEIEPPDRKEKIFFKLGSIIGDNLGLHASFGLVESFLANFACRSCKTNKFQRALATLEDPVYLRTKLDNESHV
ncbi:hypothetical protein QAD02_001736 [Eretmocerus hayati]|uniref:Uncharacterized protein n=1 Tax=Eretmocerus hayati TaxID=131215 RepID=A0ACC2NHB3_9HYME|nr:hypothetical protein QAD02_001736 [Eretmocerus hayati]